MRWRARAQRQHAVIGHAQLVAAGLSRRQVERLVAVAALVGVHRGVYRVGGAPETWEQRVMAACLASAGVASHRSAAALWGLRGCESEAVEVTVAGRRRPALAGVTGHTTARLDAVDVCERRGIPVTTPARTLLDLGGVLPAEVVEGAMEDALHRGVVSAAALERTLGRAGAMGRNGTATLRALLAGRYPGLAPTESPLEDDLVRLLHRSGLPEPVRQHVVGRPGDHLVRVDLAYPHHRVAIEAQGAAWHTGRARLQRDCDRLNLLTALGWRVLAFTSDDVRRRPRAVVASVGAALSGVETTFGARATATVAATPGSLWHRRPVP